MSDKKDRAVEDGRLWKCCEKYWTVGVHCNCSVCGKSAYQAGVAQGMEEAAVIVYPQSMRDETCGLDSFDVAYNGSREDAALSIRKANEEKKP